MATSTAFRSAPLTLLIEQLSLRSSRHILVGWGEEGRGTYIIPIFLDAFDVILGAFRAPHQNPEFSGQIDASIGP